MRYKNMAMILPLSLVSVGCSTDDIADLISDEKTVEINVNGRVIDGPISNSKVCIDTNDNNHCESDEPTTYSDDKGYYSFQNTKVTEGIHRIIATGGIDTYTDENFDDKYFTSVLDATTDSDHNLIISPASTLVAKQYFTNKNDGIEKAKIKVTNDLKISGNVDILTTDFITDKNKELFLANQNIVKNIDTLSAVKNRGNENGDTSSARFDAIDTIAKTGSLNVNENLNKMGYQESSQVPNDKSSADSTMADAQNAFDELDEETAIIDDEFDGDFDFDIWAKDIQDKRVNEVENIKGRVESFENIPPNLPSDMEKNHIALTFDKFQEKNGTLTEEEFKTKIYKFLQLSKDTDNLDFDLNNSFKDVEDGIEVFENSFEELSFDNIELDSTSSLPKTVTLADGNEVTFTLVSEKGGVAIIEFENKNESYKLSGDFSIKVNEEGQIIQSIADIEMSSIFFDGTIESMDGAKFDGSFSFNQSDFKWKGDFKNPAKEVSLSGYFNIQLKTFEKPQYMTAYENEAFTETATNYQEYKTDIDSDYQKYLENQANGFEKYKANENAEYLNHTLADLNNSDEMTILDKETAEKYMMDHNISYPINEPMEYNSEYLNHTLADLNNSDEMTILDKKTADKYMMDHNISYPINEPMEYLDDDMLLEDVQVIDSISMEIQFVSKDTKISFKAKGDQEYLSAENFSFEKSDEVTIKFNKAEMSGNNVLSGFMMNFGDSEDITLVDELPILDDGMMISPVDIDEPIEIIETDSNKTETVENTNSDLPPSVPTIEKETKKLKSQDKMARNNMNESFSISGLFIDINKDGKIFSAKGDLSTDGKSSKLDFKIFNYNDEISNLKISAIEEFGTSYVQITSESGYIVIIKEVGDATEIVDMNGNTYSDLF